MQNAQDFHIAPLIAPEEDHMPVAGTAQKIAAQIAPVLAKNARTSQSGKGFIELCQVADGLIFSPHFQCVGAYQVKIRLSLKREPECRRQVRARSFARDFSSE